MVYKEPGQPVEAHGALVPGPIAIVLQGPRAPPQPARPRGPLHLGVKINIFRVTYELDYRYPVIISDQIFNRYEDNKDVLIQDC